MELLVATWTVRLTLVSVAVVAGLTVSVGGSILDAVLRAAITAVVVTTAGRILIGVLETPEQRLARLRARHAGAGAGSRGGRKRDQAHPTRGAAPGPRTRVA